MKTKIIITISLLFLSYLKGVGQQITNGLAAAYYFTDGSYLNSITNQSATGRGDVMFTIPGNPNPITVSLDPTSVADRFGNESSAFDFDVQPVLVTIGGGGTMMEYYSTGLTINASDLIVTNYTYSFWYKLTNTSGGSSEFMISVGNDGGDQTANVINTSIRGASYYFDPGDNGGGLIFPVKTVSATSSTDWEHCAVVRTDDSLKIFINGLVKDKQKIVPVNGGGTDPFYGYGSTLAVIGARYNLNSGYTGLLDDVRLFDRALSNAEVLQEYNYSVANEYNETLTSNTASMKKGVEVLIYPNPAQDKFFIQLEGSYEYTLSTPEGIIVREGISDQLVEVTGLESGVYFIKINNTVKKVVIK